MGALLIAFRLELLFGVGQRAIFNSHTGSRCQLAQGLREADPLNLHYKGEDVSAGTAAKTVKISLPD